jgi:NAD(P)-dependent dehydrogenase (short-subunit alcohol dehydrogenase family)
MSAYLLAGANRGIGLELLRQAAKTGEKVFACVRNSFGAAQLQSLAASSVGRVRLIEMDAAELIDIVRMTRSVGRW